MTDKNQFVAEKLGEKWHIIHKKLEDDGWEWRTCSCGSLDRWYDNSLDLRHSNPDFSTDAGAVELLRLMLERKDWNGFTYRNMGRDIDRLAKIINSPGALLDAVAEWFGWE